MNNFIKYKNEYKPQQGQADQDLLNDLALGKITYLSFKYGMISPFKNDKNSEMDKGDKGLSSYNERLKLKEQFPFLPKNEAEFLRMGYSP